MSQVTSCLLVTVASVVALCGRPVLAVDLPPMPDFHRHTNYAQWYESVARVPDKDDAYSLYAEFMPGLVDSPVKEKNWPEFDGMLTGSAAADNTEVSTGEADTRTKRSPAPWFPNRRGSWEQSFKRTKAALKKFEMASKRKYVVAPMTIDGDRDDNANRLEKTQLKHVPKLRQCAQGVMENAWRIGKDGDVDPARFIASVETNIRVAGQLRTARFSIEQLTGYSIRRMTYQHIRWAFAHGVLKPADAAKLSTSLAKIDSQPLDASYCLGTECAIMLDNLQYIFGPLGGGVKLNSNRYRDVTGQTLGGGNRFALGARVDADPAGTASAVMAAFKTIDRLMEPGYATENNQGIIDAGRQLAQTNNLTKGMLYGAEGTYSRIYTLAAQCEAERRATQLLLAVFSYKPKKGDGKYAFPKKLSELDKGRVGKVLKDPFSGKTFKYFLNDGQPVLYCLGHDGEDDGGQHDEGWNASTDYVYWPLPASEEAVIASRINRVKAADMTALADIGEKLKGKRVTVSAVVESISSRPSAKHGERHSVILKDGDVEVKLYYYDRTAQEMSASQKLVEGRRIRVIGVVVKEDGKWRIELQNARDLAYEE
ncbi:MAG: OB-fold nucleic acid binding domain-containing protein [Phycisphaerae bacterium]|nr:OB-fold nucleic acid binding domain-containing protein [Phycisphaerae bacterium]